jgi:peptidoglycan/LPS O-acetylase OafA/YrhL
MNSRSPFGGRLFVTIRNAQAVPPRQHHNIPALTGIRGIAAVAVMLCHYSWQTGRVLHLPSATVNAMTYGWVWVDLFFILSGFIMVHAHRKGAQSVRAYGAFLRKRLARIWPVHAVTLTFAMLVLGPAGWGYPPSLWEHIRTFLLMHAWWNYSHPIWNGPNWSLSAEWGAYVLFPLTFLLTRLTATRAAMALALTLAATVLAHLMLANKNMGVIVECALLRAVPEFAIGVLLYRLREAGSSGISPPMLTNLAALATVVLTLLMAATGWRQGMWLTVPALAALVYGLSFGRGVLARFLSTPFMLFLGNISFSFYMVHYLVLQTGFTLMPLENLHGWFGAFYLAWLWLLTFFTAWAMHAVIERPLQKRLVPNTLKQS